MLKKDIAINISPFVARIEEEIDNRIVFYYGYPRTVNEYIYVLCRNAEYKNFDEVKTTEMQVWKWDGTAVASFTINANLSVFNISEKYKKYMP